MEFDTLSLYFGENDWTGEFHSALWISQFGLLVVTRPDPAVKFRQELVLLLLYNTTD